MHSSASLACRDWEVDPLDKALRPRLGYVLEAACLTICSLLEIAERQAKTNERGNHSIDIGLSRLGLVESRPCCWVCVVSTAEPQPRLFRAGRRHLERALR